MHPSKVHSLSAIRSVEDIPSLSVRQCKEILTLHRVNYQGVTEKKELLDKVAMLWKDYNLTRKGKWWDDVGKNKMLEW